MKFVLFVFCSVLFLGWNTVLAFDCDYKGTGNCIKQNVNCGDAGICNQYCRMDNFCMNITQSCQSTVSIVTYCARINSCSPAFRFKGVVHQICQPKYPPMTAVASAPTSFVAVFASLLFALF